MIDIWSRLKPNCFWMNGADTVMAVRSRLSTKVIGRIKPPAIHQRTDVGFSASWDSSALFPTARSVAMSGSCSRGAGTEGRRSARPVGEARPFVDGLAQRNLGLFLLAQGCRDAERL